MENFTRWDEYLIAEHELIERAMAVLKQALENMTASIKNPVAMERAIDFLLQFGDKIHNTKEEQYLFPLMQERGVPVDGGPIGVMLMEHDAERTLLAAMLQQLPGLAAASEQEIGQFKSKGMEYLAVRAEHIWKENDVLYPMGRRLMQEEDNGRLLDAFDALNTLNYGGGAFGRFTVMVEEVESTEARRKKLVENLSYQQLHAILETMPVEVTFVDAQDTVAYFNRLDKNKIFPRTRSVIGRKVEKCHPEKSVDTVKKIVEGFKNNTMDTAEFWIDFKDDKILIRYFPVRDDDGTYLGVLEVTQEIGWIQKIEGQKRLLD